VSLPPRLSAGLLALEEGVTAVAEVAAERMPKKFSRLMPPKLLSLALEALKALADF